MPYVSKTMSKALKMEARGLDDDESEPLNIERSASSGCLNSSLIVCMMGASGIR